MSIVDPLIQELERETASTRRVLERVPEDKLSWKPHEKSMSLGQLALHVARIPGDVAQIASRDEVERLSFDQYPSPRSAEECLAALEESSGRALEYLRGLDDASAMATWRMVDDGQELMAIPRIGVLRNIMLNHWYHHRGQLYVYLRMNDAPLPSVYGPTADESPFD